jgi:hypothetical protein
MDYPSYKCQNHWHSVDAHEYDAAMSVAPTFLAKQTSNGLSLAICDYAAFMIAESERLKIIDAPLTLIFRRW